jgi:hypothetical protein
MPAELFFVPLDGVAKLNSVELRAAMMGVALAPKITEERELLWLEFDEFESRRLTSTEEAPLDLITLQIYGDLPHETSLIEKLDELLESNGYCDADDLSNEDKTT